MRLQYEVCGGCLRRHLLDRCTALAHRSRLPVGLYLTKYQLQGSQKVRCVMCDLDSLAVSAKGNRSYQFVLS
jgi:hypothetical protein